MATLTRNLFRGQGERDHHLDVARDVAGALRGLPGVIVAVVRMVRSAAAAQRQAR